MELEPQKQIGLMVDFFPTVAVSRIFVIDVLIDVHLRYPGVRKMPSRIMMLEVWRTNLGPPLLGKYGNTI